MGGDARVRSRIGDLGRIDSTFRVVLEGVEAKAHIEGG